MSTDPHSQPHIPPRPLPAGLGTRFSRRTALALGVSDMRLRRSDLTILFRGMRSVQSMNTPGDDHMHGGTNLPPRTGLPRSTASALRAGAWQDRQLEAARDFSVVMLDHEFFTGYTAALLLGIRVPAPAALWHRDEESDNEHELIEVGVFAPLRTPRRHRVKGRQVQPRLAEIHTRQGLRLLTPATLWATLAPRFELSDRVAFGDALIHAPRIGGNRGPRPRPPLSTIEELIEMTHRPGRRHRAALAEALPLLRTGSASPQESKLRLALVLAGFPEPELDVDVLNDAGDYLGTTECAYSKLKIAIEYEGDHHRTETKQWNRDIEKYRAYAAAGWLVIRVTSDLLYRQSGMLIDTVTQAIQQRS